MRPLFAAFLALACAAPGAAAPPEPVVASIRARAAAQGFDGAILIGETDGSSRVLTFGRAPLRADAIWRWASITKQLLAVLAMQEVAAGRLDLEAPVSRYWLAWRAPNASRIRIRDLLFHNAGLPQPDESPADAQGVPAFYRSGAAAPQASAAGFCAGPAKAAPPAAFDYNNCDSIVLAEVLRRVTGQDFETLVRTRLVRPLGLRSTGLFVFGPPARAHVRPVGQYADLDGLLNMGVYGASGGAYGTIADLWRFDHALLTDRLMPRAVRDRMWTSERGNGYLAFFQWSYEAPLRGCANPVRIVERQGLIGGIELRNYLLPETGRGLILFSRKRPTELGDPWEGRGFAYDLLSATACR